MEINKYKAIAEGIKKECDYLLLEINERISNINKLVELILNESKDI
jgi:hypothetical protein